MSSGIETLKKIEFGDHRSVRIGRGWTSQRGNDNIIHFYIHYAFRDEITNDQIVEFNRQAAELAAELGVNYRKLEMNDFVDFDALIARLSSDENAPRRGACYYTGNAWMAKRVASALSISVGFDFE